jgi:cytochrome-b5 reductase
VEDFNHNTKKFKFKLPEEDMVSGLTIASAMLTKFQEPGMEKPVVRPYTPISDEGMWHGYLGVSVCTVLAAF